MQKITPPASSAMDDLVDDEEMVYVEDVDEAIESSDDSELDNEEDEEVMDVSSQRTYNVSEKDDAIYVFTAHQSGSLFCGSLTKNGEIAATGSEEDKAYAWNTITGEMLFECTGHKDSVIFSEFNHNETYLATGDMSGIIKLWQMSDKTGVWEYNMGDATWMKWHSSANVLLAGSVNGEVYMWKVPDGDCKVFQGYGCRAEIGTILPDGKRLAVGYEDGTIRIIDLKTNSILFTISSNTGHFSTITTLDCHTDNNLLLSAAVDGKTLLITSLTGKVISILQDLNANKENNTMNIEEETGSSKEQLNSNWVETAAFCKDPTLSVVATGTVNGELFIWDFSKQIMRHKIQQDNGISKLVWKGSTSIFFAAGLDGILRCIDARSGHCLRSFFGHVADIIDLYISEDGKKALTTSDDSTARIFNISSLC